MTAAVKVLNQDHDGKTVKEVAEMVLKAAEDKRQAQAKFASVGQFRLPDGDLNHIVIAPFATELQARRAGEGLQYDTKTKTGNGKFMVLPIVGKASEAWELIRPPALDPHEWIRQSIERQRAGIMDPPTEDSIYGKSYW